jgi:hypothetical protein
MAVDRMRDTVPTSAARHVLERFRSAVSTVEDMKPRIRAEPNADS